MIKGQTTQSARMPKDPAVYAFGNIVRRLVGFIMLPIYTRYLTPADYGVIGLLTFTMAIMEPLFGARLVEAMPKYYFESEPGERRNSVVSTAIIVTGVVSAFTAAMAFLLRVYSSKILFGTTAYALAIGWFGLQVLTQPLEYYGLSYLRILRRPWAFLAVTVSKLIIQLTLNIVLVVGLKMGVMGVVYSSVLSSFLYAIGLCAYTIRAVGVRYDGQMAKAMVRFSWPLWLSSLSSLYIYEGGTYFLRIFASLSDVGLYELATRVAAVLTFIVWDPFNQYWEAVRFKYHRDPNERSIYSNTFQFITALLVAVALCLTLGAEPVIRVMAAPAFRSAYLAVPFLVLALLLVSLSNFMRFSFLVAERTRSITVIGYGTAIVITALNLALIPGFGAAGAALALAGARLAQFIVTYLVARRYFDMGIKLKPVIGLLGLLLAASLVANFMPRVGNAFVDCMESGGVLLLALVPVAVMFWFTPFARAQLAPAIYRVRSRMGI